MEQLNPFYDEGISDNFYNLEQFNQGMSHTEINQLMHKLLSTIDLPRITEVFYQQLISRLQLKTLNLQFDDQAIVLGDWHEQIKLKTLSCVRNGQLAATLHYGFSRTLSAKDWLVLQQMHLYFSSPLKNALEHHKIKQFAMRDYLTSLGNRASYTESVGRLLSHVQRHDTPFGLLVLDLDNFKQVNDKLGHHEGDKVLVAFTQTLIHCMRESDFAFRFGGDEFCCLLPETSIETIQHIAQRISAAVTADDLLSKHQVTCSIGTTISQTQDSPNTLFSRADTALYKAKHNGRNCIYAG
ncbi:GGDEF domain-containing protein [Paraglaciecola sp.]|uniref:GGDEF domain-containing protein n=1 Tax=Paraglaciecola sp. TaxID=1920173 RepID=UPI0030F39291